MLFDRTNTTRFGRWWWQTDRVLLICFSLLMVLSAVLVTASSPPVAQRLDYDPYHFIYAQHKFLVISFAVMIGVSMLSVRTIRRMAVLGLMGSLLLMVVLPILGDQTKGATRWIAIAGLKIQPSEFMKPCFVMVLAWLLSERQRTVDFPAYRLVFAIYLTCALLLLIQPDVGMFFVVSALLGVELLLGGIALGWIFLLGAVVIIGGVIAYFTFPHVTKRIDGFLDPTSVDSYQIDKSLESFASGGLLGKGPGEGVVKWQLPDAHTDFIFAVAGEEFGLVALIIIGLFFAIIYRGLRRAGAAQDMFIMLAVAGLVTQIGIQALVNMGVAVRMFPAKGMTLPFLSYGGSSLVAVACTAGAILGLTRKQYGMRSRQSFEHYQPMEGQKG
ncbi:MAG: putative lipid II flippase FtsW [Alphaproteobacteria bacterium]|nr:MAG: putative lipid II flippase FtsW [Alphaproteobacteria bacterium]TAF40451.1 MAG: putative lipid II flippase FtsW [Alphaproteobacteria bacterium]TAF76492.1 MAG: putative lipid II flippase FtsW [Alphaproteobacteria bacterium]